MTVSLRDRGVRGVVLDIEGTTTPISFVYDVLFPYARTHLRDALRDVDALHERQLRAEHAADVTHGRKPPGLIDVPRDAARESVALYVEWLMDQDRKSPALKSLQGVIWERGYEGGSLKGVVFPDVPPALQRWNEDDVMVAIYSSGSALAQQLLFAYTPVGDLTPLIGHFFDTGFGPKTDPASYERIALALDLSHSEVLFVSDVPAELAAARNAGLQTLLAVRPKNPRVDSGSFDVVHSFEEIVA